MEAFANMNVVGGGTDANPRIGLRWYNSINYNYQLGTTSLDYMRLSSEFRFYLTPNFPFQLTWAGRVGATHNIGEYRFYQASVLGGTENLRGYRRTRYSGRSAIYANAEGRIQLFDFNLYLAPGRFGVLGLYDTGRVYHDDDRAQSFIKSLHNGYGTGIWADFLNRTVFTLTHSWSKEDDLWMLNFGFQF